MKILIENIMNVYSGKPGCACGCRGKYYSASQYKAIADKDRGYDDKEKPSDMMVKKVVNLINLATVEQIEFVTEEYVSVEIEGRSYCAYFLPKENKKVAS